MILLSLSVIWVPIKVNSLQSVFIETTEKISDFKNECAIWKEGRCTEKRIVSQSEFASIKEIGN